MIISISLTRFSDNTPDHKLVLQQPVSLLSSPVSTPHTSSSLQFSLVCAYAQLPRVNNVKSISCGRDDFIVLGGFGVFRGEPDKDQKIVRKGAQSWAKGQRDLKESPKCAWANEVCARTTPCHVSAASLCSYPGSAWITCLP